MQRSKITTGSPSKTARKAMDDLRKRWLPFTALDKPYGLIWRYHRTRYTRKSRSPNEKFKYKTSKRKRIYSGHFRPGKLTTGFLDPHLDLDLQSYILTFMSKKAQSIPWLGPFKNKNNISSFVGVATTPTTELWPCFIKTISPDWRYSACILFFFRHFWLRISRFILNYRFCCLLFGKVYTRMQLPMDLIKLVWIIYRL
jgi:hypothetical protein